MSARADSLARLLERGRQQQRKQKQRGASAPSNFLTASEAERMVKSLRPAAIHEFGTPAFLELHHTVEQLAMQAHHNAATHSDEFVADLLASHGACLGALVRGLLAAEAWRERIFSPHLRGMLMFVAAGGGGDGDNDSSTCDPWVLYCALRHEAALASLLELCLFRASSSAAAGGIGGGTGATTPTDLSLLLSESEALELADWCVRRLRHLALLQRLSPGAKDTTTTTTLCHPIARAGAWRRELLLQRPGAGCGGNGNGSDNNNDNNNTSQEARVRELVAAARALLDAPPELELDDRVVETEFQAALPALGLTRWLADAACCGNGNDADDGSPQSLALLSRLVGRPSAAQGDDSVTLLAQLLDRPPWERPAASDGGVERYCCGGGGGGSDGASSSSTSSTSSSWTHVAAADRHALAPQAAQAWLALCRLLCDPAARARWLAGASPSSSSVAAVLRLRRPLASPLLLDQAPFLVSLARVVEGLAMMTTGAGGGGGFAGGGLSASPMVAMMVEPLPGLRDATLAEAAARAAAGAGGAGGAGGDSGKKDWARALAEMQAKGAFSAARSREAAQARAASVAQAFEQYCSLLADGEGGKGKGDDDDDGDDDTAPASSSSSSSAPAATTAHVTCWRQAGPDLWEPWGDFMCRVDAQRGGGEEVSVGRTGAGAGAGAGAGGNGSGNGNGGIGVTRGLRRRLLPLAVARPFPCEGKVAVRVGDRVAEARLSLPALHSRGEGEEGGEGEGGGRKGPSTPPPPPKVVWVSVGDLARDGFVLQLRLARVPPAARERDRASGLWYAYAPAGAGALATASATGATAAGATTTGPTALAERVTFPAAAERPVSAHSH